MRTILQYWFLVLLVAGCAGPQAPLKYANNPPGSTYKNEILENIRILKELYAPQCAYELLEIKLVNDPQSGIQEEWTVKSCQESVIYQVKTEASPTGDEYFIVTPPDSYVQPEPQP